MPGAPDCELCEETKVLDGQTVDCASGGVFAGRAAAGPTSQVVAVPTLTSHDGEATSTLPASHVDGTGCEGGAECEAVTAQATNKVAALVSRIRARQEQKKTANERAKANMFKGKRSFWLTAKDEAQHVHDTFGADSWQSKVTGLIMGRKVQVGLLLLLLLDVVVVLTDLFLDAEFPPCHIILSNAVSCDKAAGEGGNGSSGHNSRLLSASHSLCDEHTPGTFETDVPAACDEHQHDAVTIAHEVLLWTSVSILSIFLLELLTLAAILGLAFWRNRLYVLDLVVVSVSFAIEIYVGVGAEEDIAAADIAAFVILVRIWRFVRIAHGISITVHENAHNEHEDEDEAAGAESLQETIEKMKDALQFQLERNRQHLAAIKELQDTSFLSSASSQPQAKCAAAYSPVNVDAYQLAMQGFCPVSYHFGPPAKGDPAITSKRNGAVYRFGSEEAKSMFDADPELYTPLYGGYCAYGMSKGGLAPSDPLNFLLIDGKLHLFLKNDEVDTKPLWEGDAACKQRADTHWTDKTFK